MATVTVEWLASAKLLKEELEATGKSSGSRRSIIIDLEQLEPDLRAEILDLTELTGMLLKSGVGLTPIRLRRVNVFEAGKHPTLAWKDVSLDAEPTAANISAEINSGNAGRIDLLIPDIPSAGLRILAAKLEWAFITG